MSEPARLTISEANGYSPKSETTPLRAIKSFCKWCCGRLWDEETEKYLQETTPGSGCKNKDCDLWRYRTGRDTLRKSTLTIEQRRAIGERLRKGKNDAEMS
jgi:hypothetical protein